MIARTYDDADRNADRELLDNDPGTTTTCASCERETPAPTSRIAGDFVMCEHCGLDVHTGELLDAWAMGDPKLDAPAAAATSQTEAQANITHAITPATAIDFLSAASKHMQNRASTYDKPTGERSMGKTVTAFNAITGQTITEEQGWLLMGILKMVRSQQGDFKADNYEDEAAYAALRGECATRERTQ